MAGNSKLFKKNKEYNLFARALVLAFEMFAFTVGVALVFGLVLGAINGKSEQFMYSSLGWAGILITGFIGTPIHEFGHYIMCILFGIKVTDVSWFRPIAAKSDGQLGYVEFSIAQNSSLQRIGCFFVGIAPLIVGTLVIILLFRILVPGGFSRAYSKAAEMIKREDFSMKSSFRLVTEIVKIIFGQIKELDSTAKKVKYIIFMIMMFSISSHMKLSMADLNGASMGIGIIIIFLYVIALIIELLGKNVDRWMLKLSSVICAFFNIALVFSLFSFVVSFCFYIIF